MAKEDGGDKISFYIMAAILIIGIIFYKPFVIVILLPSLFILFNVVVTGSEQRDEFFKGRLALTWACLFLALIVFVIDYEMQNSFKNLIYSQNSLVLYGIIPFFISLYLMMYGKRILPISFLNDAPELFKQETMYEDDNFRDLKLAYLYRGVSFKDEYGRKLTPKKIAKADSKVDISSTKIDTFDIETVILDDNEHLKFYYEKLIFDLYNDFVANKGANQDKLEKYYGYSFTIRKDVINEKDFEEALKETSLLYYKIYTFIKKDMDSDVVSKSFRFENMYKDSFHCLELTLMLMIEMLRQFMNFPVGDFPKYVKNRKDMNFIGAFASLPSEFYLVTTTSIAARGVAYYFVFYKIHAKRFEDAAGTVKRYVANKGK